jgi:hypothetical protein
MLLQVARGVFGWLLDHQRGLLVAPKVWPFLDPYNVVLPKGDWYNYWTGEKLEGRGVLLPQTRDLPSSPYVPYPDGPALDDREGNGRSEYLTPSLSIGAVYFNDVHGPG